jgi:hypothetical protein
MTVSPDAVYNDIASLTDFANSDNPAVTIWQSFTATTNEYLYGVQLYGKTPDNIIGGQVINAIGINITVYNGPNNTFPIFAQLTAANVDAQPAGWIPFVFPSPFSTLVNGNQYTIEVSGAGAENFLWGYAFVTPTTNYIGGTASFQPPSNLFFIVEKIPIPTNPNIPNTFTTIEVGDGSAAAPSYTFTSDTTTGLFLQPGPELGVSVGGIEIVNVNSNSMIPGADDTINLGLAVRRYSNLYLAQGAGGDPFFRLRTSADIPIIRGSGADPAVTYVTQSGRILCIGTVYFITGEISWSAFAGGAGNIFIESTVTADISNVCVVNVIGENIGYPAGSVLTSISNTGGGSILLNLFYTTAAAANTAITVADMPAAGTLRYTGIITGNPNGVP